MRRFSVFAPAIDSELLEVWLDSGFITYNTCAGNDDCLRPDVYFAKHCKDEDAVKEINVLKPKVVVLESEIEPDIGIDDGMILYHWRYEGESFFIASFLEQRLTPPPWEAYSGEVGLGKKAAMKAVSDRIYRYLLADVFRETMEWCGHTFSVVTHI